MENRTTGLLGRLTSYPEAKYLFVGLVLALLAIAVGHLYVLDGLTSIYLGLPLWVWLQIVVVFVMLAIAWFAIRLVAVVTERGE